jgi:hypothetical protein
MVLLPGIFFNYFGADLGRLENEEGIKHKNEQLPHSRYLLAACLHRMLIVG